MEIRSKLVWSILLAGSFCYVTRAGETCTFSDGDATVSVFCDDGCCDSQCCGDSSVDETAIAIAIAAVIGLLLLLIFIVLILYCYYRKKDKTIDDEESKRQRKKSAFANTTITRSFHPVSRNNFSQTGDPLYANRKDFMPNSRDKVIYGHGARWNNFNPFPDPQPLRPDSEIDDKQVQTDKTKSWSTVQDLSGEIKSKWAQGPEPNVTVPAPYWRYHKKSTNESKDVYSLMEKKAKLAEKGKLIREDEHELGEYKYEDESAIDMSTGSRNTGSLSD
ncbi:hypothetical protein PoB_004779300 [Plakobranchus ocellatus]|uniref:CX domain-containing protein n=1 Tax=Plakobranchus ocellatus TaxID=259542 RepID=A0AAV4BQ99_9GAST|nr:hypothetical protein PoB_004779300 [Plakobranchus ocellatus]